MKLKLFFLLVWAVYFIFSSSRAEASEIYTGVFGSYADSDWGNVLDSVSSSKFKIVLGGSSKMLLDESQKRGLKNIVMLLPSAEIANDEVKWQKYLEDLRRVVTTLKSHPAVFAWMPLDEPDYIDVPVAKIKIIRSTILAIDATHPVFTVLSEPAKWAKYFPYFDIISIDPYLKLGPNGVREKPDKIDAHLKALNRDLRKLKTKKPVWITLGAFDLKPKLASQSVPFVKPTPGEFRQMVDLSLQNGVAGILVYSLAFKGGEKYQDWDIMKNDPLLWNAVKEIPGRALLK